MEKVVKLLSKRVKKENSYTLVPLPICKGICKSLTFILFAFLFSSCDFFFEPVRGYFEKWTNEVAIAKYELVGVDPYTDKDGNLCIPSGQDVPVILYLRNPYHYKLGTSNTTEDGIVEPDYSRNPPYIKRGTFNADAFDVIEQDANDTTVLHFTYKNVGFLEDMDGGRDIGGTLEMLHPYNPISTSFDINLKCNSKPPVIAENDAAIMKAKINGQTEYVLAFICPNTSGIHKDIVSITINGTECSALPNGSGGLVFGDERFKTTRPSDLIPINKKFDPDSRAVYFLSGEQVPEDKDAVKSKIYTIGLTDKAGLKTFNKIEASEPKMSIPIVKNNKNVQLSESTTNKIKKDNGNNIAYSTIRIAVQDEDELGEPVNGSNPKVHWTLKNISGVEVPQDQGVSNPSPNTVSLKISEQGTYTLETWASADNHADSTKKTYTIELKYDQLEPPVLKSNDVELTPGGSINYIAVNPATSKATVNVEIPTQTVGGDGVTGTVAVYYQIYKEPNTNPIHQGNETDDFDLSNGLWRVTVKATCDGYTSSELTYYIRAYSSDFYVSNSGSDEDDGTAASPYATIGKAVSEIATYGLSDKYFTIHVKDHLTLSNTQTISSNLDGKAAGLTLTGDDNGILDGGGSVRVLEINTVVPVTITKLTIQNGRTSGNGGGIYNTGNLSIGDGVTMQSNSAANGGAIYHAGNSFDISSSASIVSGGSAGSNDVYLASGKTVALPNSSWTGTMTITPQVYDDTSVYLTGNYVGTHYTKISVTPQVSNGVTTKWITTEDGKIEKGIRCTAAEAISEIPTLANDSKIVVVGAITSDQVLDIGTEMNKRYKDDSDVRFALDLSGTTGLTTIPEGQFVSGGPSIGFRFCKALESITLPTTVTSLAIRAFANCTNLKTIDGLNNVSSIGAYAFSYTAIEFFDFTKTKITGDLSSSTYDEPFQNMFMGSSLQSITIPKTITKLPWNFLSYCQQLTSVTFENGSPIDELPQSTFADCTSLASITNLPSGIKKIGTNAFTRTAFTSFVVPNGVTEIEDQAFQAANSLTELVVPTSVNTIGNILFMNCPARSVTIKYKGNEMQWNAISKGARWNKQSNNNMDAVETVKEVKYNQ
ncbi:MAG: leucine-rich repeat protein [Treponema sp.]|nr:leucine-rich repeat protein [Treponema sp.]